MCLSVTHVPTSARAARVVPVRKRLIVYQERMMTPHRRTLVPESGLLMPLISYRTFDGFGTNMDHSKELYHDDSIYGGVIHSYHQKPSYMKGSSRYYNFYKAYALGVVAYGVYDLVSHGLYIPHCDKMPGKKARQLLLSSCAERMATVSQILNEFPDLEGALA